MIELNKIYCENCLDTLSKMDDNSIDCCVTSPPYYGLRSYLPDVVVLKDDVPDWVLEEIKGLGIKPFDIK